MLAGCPGPANGSVPSISNVGEPCMPHRAASPSVKITSRDTETPSRPSSAAASRSSRSGAFGHSGTARTVRCICPAPVLWLPGQVAVEPLERGPDPWPLVPAARHDFSANRFGCAAQPLAHHRRLIVPGPALQEVHTIDADANLGVITEMDQR